MATSDHHRTRLRALAHPLRLQILSLLTGEAMSAAEVARALGCTQANASYHLRVLRTAGFVEPAEQVSIRGGQAVRYRYVSSSEHEDDDAPVTRLPVEEHLTAAAVLGQELQRRTALRDPRHPGTTTDAELWVRPEHWQQFQDAVRSASDALHAHARPTRTRGTIRTSTTVSAFRMLQR